LYFILIDKSCQERLPSVGAFFFGEFRPIFSMSERSSHRLFLGIPIPADHLGAFADLRQSQPALPGLRWVREGNLHITVYFFGKVQTEQMDNLFSLLQLSLQEQAPFSLHFRNYQFAPRPKSPRMIWARYEKSEAFQKLGQSVHRLYQQIEPELQVRLKPKPHVTLARLKKPDLGQIDLKSVPTPSSLIEVERLVLWESVLRPEGAVYSVRKTFPLE
jgi:2'-5' RNA ligase